MSGQNVLLTGGNGFIAVHILLLLLDCGYSVTATVRSESKTTYLRIKFSQSVDNGQLKFAIVPDVTVSRTFDEILNQVPFDAVLHTSSPFVFEVYVLSFKCGGGTQPAEEAPPILGRQEQNSQVT